MKTTLMVITDGRAECLARTIDSLRQMVKGDIAHKLLIDDSCKSNYAAWLICRFSDFEILHTVPKQGFCGAIQTAWAAIKKRYPDTDFLMHLEDDFIFNRQVNVAELVEVLQSNPSLAQIALKRQPWNPAEEKAGGIVEMWPDLYQDRNFEDYHWLEHRLFFTTNPSMYPKKITEFGWPGPPACEQAFTETLKNAGYSFAYWGKRSDLPWVYHIGNERVGCGY